MNLKAIFRPAAIALACACTMAAPAHAGLFDDEEARRAILELRTKVDANRQAADQRAAEDQRVRSEESGQLRRSLLELQQQIEALRGEVAGLRGQNEQATRELSEMQRRQKDITQGLEERLKPFEPAKVQMDGREFTATPEEKREYDAALAIFRKGDFAAAQNAFVGFIRRFPTSGYNPTALFWLGNSQYATRDYKESIINFRQMIAQAPDHPRAPEAVLSIANCQIELKDTKSARKTLEDLMKAYPQSEAAVAGKERLARLK